MARHQISLVVIFSISVSFAFGAISAVSNEEKLLLEELTGKKPSVVSVKKNKSAAEKHLEAGLSAFQNSNYISALKSYNIVINSYAQSPQLRAAYLAKAQLYTKMGLAEPARFNFKLAAEEDQKQIK